MTHIQASITCNLVNKKRNDYAKSIRYLPQMLGHEFF